MKHLFKFTHIMAVAFAAVTMLGFSACNDEPIQPEKEKTTRLEQEIKEKTDSLQNQVDDLQDQINELKTKTCMCEVKTKADVAKIVGDSLKNYWNITEVQNFVNTKLNDYVLVTTYQTMVDSLRGALNDINAHLKNHCDSIGQLYTDLAALNTAVSTAQATANAAKGLAERDSARIDTLVTNIYTTVNNLAGRVTTLEGQMTTVRDSIAQVNALATRDSIRLDALETLYDALHATDSVQQDQLDSIKTALLDFATHAEVNAVKTYADSLHNVAKHYADSLHTIVMDTLNTFDARITTLETILPIVRDSVQLLSGKIDTLRLELDSLKAVVAENTRRIDSLSAVTADVFSKTIYGVVIQGTYNPVFGYFALPLGWQSNVLMAYYGNNDHVTYFPTVSTADLVYDEYALTAADAAMLGGTVDSYSIAGGTTFLSEGANAGKIYFNVNPNTADLTDAEFTLVNTVDEEAGIKLDTVRPCTEKLTFGYTGPMSKAPVAGQSANGFYEAAAVLEEGGIATAKIQIEPELKQAVKDFYHQHIQGQSARSSLTSISASDFSQLAQGIYQQFNGFAPRYGVKATWTDSLGTHSAMSGAGVAAIAVKPLSYAFFKDRSLKHLPNITPVSDLSDFNIDLKNIHFNISFNINHAHSNLHLQATHFEFPDSITAEVTIPNVNKPVDPITGQFPDTTYIAKASLETLEDSINNQFQRLLGIWNDSIDVAIDQMVNGLIDEINNQVHDFADDVEGQLNSQIQDVVDDAKAQVVNKFGGYIDKVNKVIGKINAAINRVNRFLDNPNKFLQTTLAYEGKDKKFHLMSTTKTIPSVFTGSGAIMLYPTSYNAEIAAPAYKKFIAVTNVYKNGDMSVSAQGGNGACISALNAVNSQENFNEVLEGGRYGVAFVPTTGYTYEIFYAALDYHGMISQRKYYVTVK